MATRTLVSLAGLSAVLLAADVFGRDQERPTGESVVWQIDNLKRFATKKRRMLLL